MAGIFSDIENIPAMYLVIHIKSSVILRLTGQTVCDRVTV
ncbi:hypothetical protein CE91St61_01660 [Lachnospiraceae bacterium]|nr:hypothetical protein CE91St61_01660 [Lachnospiraceae bacterium]